MQTVTELAGDLRRNYSQFGKSICSNMYCALIGIVDTVDYTNQTLTAKPATKMKFVNNEGVVQDFDMPLLVDVPFQCYRGGDFAITVPVRQGDEVLIVFTDVDFSAWWQNGGFQYAEHSFRHYYSNAIAIVGVTSTVRALPNYNSTAVEVRNLLGTEKISLTSGNITLKSATITLDGNVAVTGTTNLAGTTTIQSVEFLTHTHTGGTISGNTGVVNTGQ